jgi:hypothetical protein
VSAALQTPCVLTIGSRTCIAFHAGRKYLHVVRMDTPIAVDQLPLERAPTPLQLKGKPYPVRRAARAYLRSEIAKTDRARQILRKLAAGATEVRA